MNIYRSTTLTDYSNGIALICAESQEQAITLLKDKEDIRMVEGADYVEKDYRIDSIFWSKPELIDYLSSNSNEAKVLEFVYYAE